MAYSLIVHLSIGIFIAAISLLFDSFYLYELGLYLLFAMAAQGLGFCWGKTGILPLGNAVFFGFSAYLSGYILKNFNGLIVYFLLFLAVLIPTIFAFILARVLLKKTTSTHSLFFSLITMALSLLAFLIANTWSSVTGGFNGMLDIPSIANLDSIDDLYWVILVFAVGLNFFLYYLSNSPFGLLLQACSSNELRVKFLGFSTITLKSLAFCVGAFCASLAGMLYAPHQSMVAPQAIGFFLSAELVIWCAIGGRFSIYGPLLGTIIIGFMSSTLRESYHYWEVIIALLFLAVVLFSPKGIVGIITNSLNFLGINHLGKAKQKVLTHILPPRAPVAFSGLSFTDVNLTIAETNIINNLSFTLDKPNIFALIGPNGAGKTTLFNALTKSLPYQSGNIYFNDKHINKYNTEDIVNFNLSRKFQMPTVFNNLTVHGNLQMSVWSKRLTFLDMFKLSPLAWTSDLLDDVLNRFSSLQCKKTFTAGELSQGEKQMLDFAIVVLTEPSLMLLDEPCAGLSPTETKYMIESIKIFKEQLGCAVLMIEHDMNAVQKIANHVLVLHKGSLFFQGTMLDVKNSKKVQSIYSGGHK